MLQPDLNLSEQYRTCYNASLFEAKVICSCCIVQEGNQIMKHHLLEAAEEFVIGQDDNDEVQEEQEKDVKVHPDVEAGDTVRVHVRIVEGERERIQVFQGIVIRARKGSNDASITVRRIASAGIGVERTFLINSPRIEKIEITRRAKVRRAQLYYLRNRRGKAARLKERRRRS